MRLISLQVNSQKRTSAAAFTITVLMSFMHSPPITDTPILNGTPSATATATTRRFNIGYVVQICKCDADRPATFYIFYTFFSILCNCCNLHVVIIIKCCHKENPYVALTARGIKG